MGFNWSKRVFDFRAWLREQAPQLVEILDVSAQDDDIPTKFTNDRFWHYSMLLNTLLRTYEERSRDPIINAVLRHSRVSTSMSDHSEEDYAGADQGGSWDAEPFAFRAGIIMTLGALEEFERGVLRILTNMTHENKSYIMQARPFRPRLADFRRTNPLWEKLDSEGKTHFRNARIKLLRKYKIELPQEAWRARLDKAWKARNEIAHGFGPVNATLGMYLHTYYDAFAAMIWLGEACLSAQNVSL
jgi:hypothetical protein